jgi:hypothetical protein
MSSVHVSVLRARACGWGEQQGGVDGSARGEYVPRYSTNDARGR